MEENPSLPSGPYLTVPDHGFWTPSGVTELLDKIERASKAAFDAYLEGMHFHEVALRSAFEAEQVHQALCKEIVEILGPPKGVRTVS